MRRKYSRGHLAVCGLVVFLSKVTTAQSDFWERINGPYGRTVTVLAVNSLGHILAGTDSGLFRSTDQGYNWTYAGFARKRVTFLGFPSEELFT